MTSTPFINIGHAGASAYATENTLSSIQTAIDCGVDMVELDVRRTKDGQLVLNHDQYLRSRQGKLKINRHTHQQLLQLNLRGGETIATLEEALRFIGNQALINIDIKEPNYEQDIYQLVQSLHLNSRVMYSSLSLSSLQRIKKLNPDQFVALSYPTTALIRLYEIPFLKPFWDFIGRRHRAMNPLHRTVKSILPYKVRRLLKKHHIDALIIRSPFISPKLVDIVHNQELKLYSWPADAPSDVAKLRELGVDGLSSNRPDILKT